MIIDTDKCWHYAGAISDKGYGRLWTGKRYEQVHRLMWEEANNRVIPEGYHVDHLCRVRCCINPEHLEPVTPRENTLRGATVPAFLARRTHCLNGHEYTKENTYKYGNTRCCRACKNNWANKNNARLRAMRSRLKERIR